MDELTINNLHNKVEALYQQEIQHEKEFICLQFDYNNEKLWLNVDMISYPYVHMFYVYDSKGLCITHYSKVPAI